MYTRHINIKEDLVFITENLHKVRIITEFPLDIVFYVETEDDWWFEKVPYNGREKILELRPIALRILKEAESSFTTVENMLTEYNENLEYK
jgi:hypothetical protein